MDGVSPKFVLPETFDGVKMEITGQLGMIWELVKGPVIVPLLQLAVYICLLMSLMLLCERVYMGIVIVLVKLFWKKPHKRYKFEPIQDDEELGSSNFPVVLVQIPMFNEREVSFISICSLLCFFPLFSSKYFSYIFYPQVLRFCEKYPHILRMINFPHVFIILLRLNVLRYFGGFKYKQVV